MTKYQLHVKKWGRGCGSMNCSRKNTRVCLGRGQVPCDILFIGEAPGEGENVLGRPFVGPAGQLLDRIIEQSIGEENQHRAADGRPPLRHAFTNLVGCIPREEDGSKAGEPHADDIIQCSDRLLDFIDVCDPKLLVLVGSHARDWVGGEGKENIELRREIPWIHIVHPAYILRGNALTRGIDIQKCIATITHKIIDLFDPH